MSIVKNAPQLITLFSLSHFKDHRPMFSLSRVRRHSNDKIVTATDAPSSTVPVAKASGSIELEQLPDDILTVILSSTDEGGLLMISRTNKRLFALADARLWRALLLAKFRASGWPIPANSTTAADAISRKDAIDLLFRRLEDKNREKGYRYPPWHIPRVNFSGPPRSRRQHSSFPPIGGSSAIDAGFFANLTDPMSIGLPATAAPTHQLASVMLAAAATIAYQPTGHDNSGPYQHNEAAAHHGSTQQNVLPTVTTHYDTDPPHVVTWAVAHQSPTANGHLQISSCDGRSVRYVGRLGGNRAVICDAPLPNRPYPAVHVIDGSRGRIMTASGHPCHSKSAAINHLHNGDCHNQQQDPLPSGSSRSVPTGSRTSSPIQLTPSSSAATTPNTSPSLQATEGVTLSLPPHGDSLTPSSASSSSPRSLVPGSSAPYSHVNAPFLDEAKFDRPFYMQQKMKKEDLQRHRRSWMLHFTPSCQVGYFEVTVGQKPQGAGK